MSEHLSAQIVEEYGRRVLSPAELLAAGDHLARCEDCRRLASEVLPVDSIVSGLSVQLQTEAAGLEAHHLSYEQIAALVDNELEAPQREALEGHLETCALCAEEVKDLRAFRPEALAGSARKPEPLAQPTLWQKIEAFMRAARLSQRPALTAAFALLFVSTSVALFFVWRATRRPESPQRSGVEATPGSTLEANNGNVAQPSPSPMLPPDEPLIVLTLNDGGELVTLDATGNLAGLGSLTPSLRQTVKQALTTERVETPSELSELSGTKGTLLGSKDQSAGFSLLSPIGTITRSDQPTLRWRQLNGATSYTVAILDSDFNSVATSPQLTGTSWTPLKALDRGRVYSWQVTAVREGKEVISPPATEPEARFKVLEKAKSDEVRSLEKAAADSHLARGAIYARAGLLDDAERELRALLAANPQSPTARKLLQGIQAIRKR